MKHLVLAAALALAGCMQAPDEFSASGTRGSDTLQGDPVEIAHCAAKRFDSDACGLLGACPTSTVRASDQRGLVVSRIGDTDYWMVDLTRRPDGATVASYTISRAAVNPQTQLFEVSGIVRACAKSAS